MPAQQIKFYQTGSFVVGNRLLDPEQRSVQADTERTNSLNCGHRACQGCGESLGARYALDAAMRATDNQLIAVNATGCLKVFSTPYPETSWRIPWLHSLFGNAPAVATGVGAALRERLSDLVHPSVATCTAWSKFSGRTLDMLTPSRLSPSRTRLAHRGKPLSAPAGRQCRGESPGLPGVGRGVAVAGATRAGPDNVAGEARSPTKEADEIPDSRLNRLDNRRSAT
jgi:hypothetical protein